MRKRKRRRVQNAVDDTRWRYIHESEGSASLMELGLQR